MRRRTATIGRNQNRVRAGDLPNWTLRFADDMNYNHPVGAIVPNQQGLVTVPDLANRFTFYADGWSTTHDGEVWAKRSTEPGYPGNWPAIVSKYSPSTVVSFQNSLARFRLHSEMRAGVKTATGATMKPIIGSNYKFGPYGRVSFRMRSTNVLNDAGVNLSAAGITTDPNLYWNWVPLAIDSNNWGPYGTPNGEIDFPEGGMDRGWAGNWHPAANPDETWHITSGESPYTFHVCTWEWTPGLWQVWVDGVLRYSTTDRVPTLAMAFLFQFECDWRQPTGEATAEVDWVVMWDYTPGSVPSSGAGTGPALAHYDLATYDHALYGA